jgi:hypothetical protein
MNCTKSPYDTWSRYVTEGTNLEVYEDFKNQTKKEVYTKYLKAAVRLNGYKPMHLHLQMDG